MAEGEIEGGFGPHDAPREVAGVGMEIVTEGWEKEPHAHRKAQLVMAVRGMVTCEVAKGMWLVPPECALWIPGDMQHSVRAVGEVELYCLFLDPNLSLDLPPECCTMSVSALLRELVIAVSQLPALYDPRGRSRHLVDLMMDELRVAPVECLHLPMPSDSRLRKIAHALTIDPSDRATIGEWGRRVAMSERTLSRLITRETGMSFIRWRQQYQIMTALERLAEGSSVQAVAFDLGYESASAFINMFKRAMGAPPARYLEHRRRTWPAQLRVTR